MRRLFPIATLALALAVGPALAKDKKDKHQAPDEFKKVVACRQIADPAARLACYDEQVAALDAAEQAGQVVVADKQEVEATQKGLFGFSVPKTPLLGEDSAKIDQIETKVVSASLNASGRWRIVMEDGAVWEQVDTEVLAFDPRPGDKVVIKRAAMGSYKARIGGQPGIRMRRIQ